MVPAEFLAPLAAAAGALTASLAGPLACRWDRGGIKRRLRLLGDAAPTSGRLQLGAALLAVALASGAALAYAAEPSAPEQLPKEVVGVVGSGDRLSLEVKSAADPAPRTLKVGQDYKDGWKLQALTPASATLTKNGQVREVGLNPDGAVAQLDPDAAPSVVTALGARRVFTIDVGPGPVSAADLPTLNRGDRAWVNTPTGTFLLGTFAEQSSPETSAQLLNMHMQIVNQRRAELNSVPAPAVSAGEVSRP